MMHTDKREPFFSFGIGGSGSGVPFNTHGAGRYSMHADEYKGYSSHVLYTYNYCN